MHLYVFQLVNGAILSLDKSFGKHSLNNWGQFAKVKAFFLIFATNQIFHQNGVYYHLF